MKKGSIYIISMTVLLTIQSISYSQSIKNNIINYNIDTIQILPAVGYISCPNKGKILPNDSLNAIFISNLKQVIPRATRYKVSYISNDSIIDEASVKYLVNIIPRFKNMTEETFSRISIGADLERLINKQSGRYFAFIIYHGFVNVNIGNQLAKGIALGVATALLTGGLYSVYTVPDHPYLVVDLFIIDKQSNGFLYYRGRYFSTSSNGMSPFCEEKLQKYFTRLFEKL
jgi:hypothetical protein